MSAETATLAGREAANALMQDSCTITDPGAGVPVWDDATGLWSDPPDGAVYSGPCRVQLPNVQASTTDAAQVEWALGRFVVSVPMSVTGLAVGQTVTVTGSVLDPSLVGARMTVRGVPAKTFMTSRRLQCEAAT